MCRHRQRQRHWFLPSFSSSVSFAVWFYKSFEKWWGKMCHARRFSYLFFVFLCIFPCHSSGFDRAREWKEQLLILFAEVEMLCLNVYFCNSCRRTSANYLCIVNLWIPISNSILSCANVKQILCCRAVCVCALTPARYDFTTVFLLSFRNNHCMHRIRWHEKCQTKILI